MVHVYAETLTYLVYEQVEKISVFSFIGNLGGILGLSDLMLLRKKSLASILGLWLGASLLTLVQLIFFIADGCLYPKRSATFDAKV